MSTTFGVRVLSLEDELDVEYIKVAFRSSRVIWTNPLAILLADDVEVEPLDNTAQGIHTIGDIRREVNEDKLK